MFLVQARGESQNGLGDHGHGRRGGPCFWGAPHLKCGTALLLTTFVVGLLGMSLAADAQPVKKISRIGMLYSERFLPGADPRLPFFLKLRELGWVDGQNVVIKEVHADGNLQRLPALAVDLVNSGVDIIVAWGGTPADAGGKTGDANDSHRFPVGW